MITKDQLELLKAPLKQNKELRYTIGGAVEATVHSSVESERIGKLNRGHRAMNEASQQLENDMAFSSREGLARAQFQNKSMPEQDRTIAEQTWQHNHITAHEHGFERASTKLNKAVQDNFNQIDEFKQAMENGQFKTIER
jgi:superoxide dismutase